MDRHRLRDDLTRFLLETGRIEEKELAPDAPLITSGLINSMTLFNLALWIEEAVGRPVDLSRITLPAQWDSIEKIVEFVEQQAGHGRAR